MRRVRTKRPVIPPDLVTDILSCLPIKSLCRLRCVCKTWLHMLTTDPRFSRLPFHQSSKFNWKIPSILVSEIGCGRKTVIYSEEVTPRDEAIEVTSPVKKSHMIVGSCNGIICLVNRNGGNGVHLWNPITKEHCAIPEYPADHKPLDWKSLFFGFGFHEGINQYKVVRVANSPYGCYSAQVDVHGLGGSCGWRSLRKNPYRIQGIWYPYKSNIPSAALVKGALHWIANAGNGTFTVIAFDLKDEVFRKLQLPCIFDLWSLQELGGLLCYFQFNRNGVEGFDMWEMKEYGVFNSWEKRCRIQPRVSSPSLRDTLVVGCWKNGEIIVCQHHEKLLLYNNKGELIKGIETSMPAKYNAWSYIPSLVSPKTIARAG